MTQEPGRRRTRKWNSLFIPRRRPKTPQARIDPKPCTVDELAIKGRPPVFSTTQDAARLLIAALQARSSVG